MSRGVEFVLEARRLAHMKLFGASLCLAFCLGAINTNDTVYKMSNVCIDMLFCSLLT